MVAIQTTGSGNPDIAGMIFKNGVDIAIAERIRIVHIG